MEAITVRKRERHGGDRKAGREHSWIEHQVVSGRAIVSRHDTEELANKAADSLRADRQARVNP